MRAVVTALTCLHLFVVGDLLGQSGQYEQAGKRASGREVVAVFISASFCLGCRDPELKSAVEEMKLALRDRGDEGGFGFRVVGVALDWDPNVGKSYLDEFGFFDEMSLGSNWFGLGPEVYIWSDTTVQPAIPQLLLYEHSVVSSTSAVRFTDRVVLKRLLGKDEIVAWLDEGAPLR